MTARQRLGAAAVVAVALAWPLQASSYWLGLSLTVLTYAAAALGLDLIYGYSGMLSLGHGAFFGIGAYTVAVGGRETSLSGLVLLTGAVAVSCAFGLVVGLVALRTTGYYFSLLTLAFALIVASVIKGVDWTGGPSGIGGVSRDLFGTGQLTVSSLYGIAVAVLLAGVLFVRSLRRSRKGRALAALRTDPDLAAAVGVDVLRLELQAFVLGCGFTGLAGGLFAQALVYVSPEFVGLTQSIQFLIMVVIGGMGTAWGALVGAVVVRGIPEAVQSLRDWQLLVLGAVTLVVLVRFRLGVVGTVESWLRRRGDRAAGRADRTGRAGRAGRAGDDRAGGGAAASGVPVTGSAVPLRRPDGTPGLVPLLEVSGLGRRFGGVTALAGVNLQVTPGQIHALIGPNGAGKSTFINLVTGIDRPTSGQVSWKRRDITGMPPHRCARLGMARTFQLVALCPELTVLENMALGAYPHTRAGLLRGGLALPCRAEERAVLARAHHVLDRLGLAGLASKRPDEIPVGQRRLVEVGRALMAEAELLLLDEPAAGLNETETNELAGLLRDMRSEGTAILLVEHDMRLVMDVSDVVTVLDFGVPLRSGAPSEVAQDERVVAAYLGVDA